MGNKIGTFTEQQLGDHQVALPFVSFVRSNNSERQWNTNDAILSSIFGKIPGIIEQRILEINLRTTSDEISVDVMNNLWYLQNLKPANGIVISAIAKLYDPIRFLGPFTVTIKLMLQSIWKENTDLAESREIFKPGKME
uniref:Uncharacterized protein n=1 Tax=Glossina austeni TaxID=7395 RepID=A0A1A9VNL2_GLOAU